MVQVDPVLVPGADEVVVWVNGAEVARATDGDRGHFVLGYEVSDAVILAVGGFRAGARVAFRAARVVGG